MGISFLPRLFKRELVDKGLLNAFDSSPPLPGIAYCFRWRTDDTRSFISTLSKLAKQEVDYTLPLVLSR